MNPFFDTIVDRTGTHSMKWEKYEGTDILPMWVADMDFKVPPPVLAALKQVIDHGVLGYTRVPHDLNQIVVKRLKTLYHWEIEPDWLVWIPGVVSGLNVVCRAFGDKNQTLVTTTPIYPPFLSVSDHCGKPLTTLPMVRKFGRATLDFEALENAFKKQPAVFLFCSPYNPCGTLFTETELRELDDLCETYDVLLCSDEIHSDFVLDPENRHIPTATISETAARRTITLMAPSKTYNIPGLGCAFAVISNPDLRARFKAGCKGIVPTVNLMGFTAATAAYGACDDWLKQLIAYLADNRNQVMKQINALPGCRLDPIAATYLAWIDVRETGLTDPVRFFEQGGVGLSDGSFFGSPGFVRLNFGCPAAVLEKGLDRMAQALKR
ncbi:MAG: PatB family C-S lyase [Desulfotignum sp.]|nr:PatB family C-S lyase [Desulfotignum sp.]